MNFINNIITNWNRHNQFSLQECTNRRIIFCNEPNFEDGVEETLKMLFGGDQCGVRIKFEGDAVIARMPIICLSNNDCFSRRPSVRECSDTFGVRIRRYVTCIKKPHPLAIGFLLARWKIVDWTALSYNFSDVDRKIFNSDILCKYIYLLYC